MKIFSSVSGFVALWCLSTIAAQPTSQSTGSFQPNTQNSDATGSCTFCDSSNNIDSSLTLAGVPCDQWAMLAVLAPPGDQCTLLRAAAVQFCGCESQVQQTCQLCPDGSRAYDSNQSLLLIRGLTCNDIEDMPAVDGNATCSFVERFSYICGCPGVAPECSLCGKGLNGYPLPMANPNEVLAVGNPAKNQSDTTCALWDKLLSLETLMYSGASAQGRAASSSTSGCAASKQAANDNLGLQLDGICGCPNVKPNGNCDICDAGYVLQDTMKCQTIGSVAPFVTNATSCETMKQAALQSSCCVVGTGESLNASKSSSTSFAQMLFGWILALAIVGASFSL